MIGSTAPADRPLHEQLAHLRLLERAAAAANECGTLEEAAQAVLEAVCAYTGWPVGHLYVSSAPDGEFLVPTTIWYLDDPDRFQAFRKITETTPMGVGVGLPGRIRATGRPAWIPDVRQDPNFPRGAGEGVEVRAAFGFPVMVGTEVVAVLEFFAEEAVEPDVALLDLMTGVGHQLARVVERTRATAALRQSEERYRALTQSAQDAIITADPDGVIVSFNTGAERTFGYAAADVVGQPLTVLMPTRFRDLHEAGLNRLRTTGEMKLIGQTIELAGLHADGSEFPLELSLSTWETGDGRFYSGIIRDISERKEAEQEREAFQRQLTQRALHDPLTALPNRALLQDRLSQAMVRASRRDGSVGVLCLDLDRFKVLNDGLGHPAGDQLLLTVASRLREAMRMDDTVARVGADEFAILRDEISDAGDATGLVDQVLSVMGHPFELRGHEVTVSASIGVAWAPGAGGDPDQLLRDAEVALERARGRGPGHVALYDPSMRTDTAERLAVERDLRLALREGHLRLHYQPIVDLSTGAVSGVEALVRWEHPSRGLLLPQDFISLAEDSGLIVPLGRWVLQQACQQGALWQSRVKGDSPLRMSVNVSALQFQQKEWAEEVAAALKSSNFEPGQLVLEITESVLMDDIDTTSRRLMELRSLGVRVAIDDFGTGYSSLGYLRQMPVDILKVDKSFIDGVAEGPHESALARAVIKLAATLKLDAVAEGVSSRKQLMMLRRLRCGYAQGYYFARPQPVTAIDALLDKASMVGDAVVEVRDAVFEAGD